jgi:hypothetical protein
LPRHWSLQLVDSLNKPKYSSEDTASRMQDDEFAELRVPCPDEGQAFVDSSASSSTLFDLYAEIDQSSVTMPYFVSIAVSRYAIIADETASLTIVWILQDMAPFATPLQDGAACPQVRNSDPDWFHSGPVCNAAVSQPPFSLCEEDRMTESSTVATSSPGHLPKQIPRIAQPPLRQAGLKRKAQNRTAYVRPHRFKLILC